VKFEPVPETLELTVADAAKVAALLAAGTHCQWQAAPAGGSVTGPHACAPPRPPVLCWLQVKRTLKCEFQCAGSDGRRERSELVASRAPLGLGLRGLCRV
jgi:hypothetical protein